MGKYIYFFEGLICFGENKPHFSKFVLFRTIVYIFIFRGAYLIMAIHNPGEGEGKKTISSLTTEYIEAHPYIKACLKKGLLNYSSLARLISVELNLPKTSQNEAILVAARRYKSKLDSLKDNEKNINSLLSKSATEVKNKIVVFVLNKNIAFENLEKVQRVIKEESGAFYFIEGSGYYTIITQEKYAPLIITKFSHSIIKQTKSLSMLILNSSKEIENMPGVVAYLTSLFSENGLNILEIISCWTDTIFIINSKDLVKAIGLLEF